MSECSVFVVTCRKSQLDYSRNQSEKRKNFLNMSVVDVLSVS